MAFDGFVEERAISKINAEARTRREQIGANRLIPKPRRPAWKVFVDQIKNLLIAILLGAVLLAWAIGDYFIDVELTTRR